MATLTVGDGFPEGVVFTYIPYTPANDAITACGFPQTYDASAEFKNKKVVIFAVPGAFTPTCQEFHLPGYVANLDALKSKGVDQVICIAYNDAWVMSAWAKANGIKDNSILFLSDAGLDFTNKLGWASGERTERYAVVVDHGKIVYAEKETKKGSLEKSGAEAVLSKL